MDGEGLDVEGEDVEVLDDELLDCELWQPPVHNAITQMKANSGLRALLAIGPESLPLVFIKLAILIGY